MYVFDFPTGRGLAHQACLETYQAIFQEKLARAPQPRHGMSVVVDAMILYNRKG
jgi:hypothetical protein